MKEPGQSAWMNLLSEIAPGFRRMAYTLCFALSILFLSYCNLARAADLNSSQIMIKYIIPVVKSYQKSGGDFQASLLNRKDIEIPTSLNIKQDFSKLPIKPNQDLLESIQSQEGDFGPPPFDLVWIESKQFGGLSYIEGSGACEYWIMFHTKGPSAVPVYPPDIFQQYVCGNDGGGFGHEAFIADINNQVVAIKDGIEPNNTGTLIFDVYLQVWDGTSWGQTAEEHVVVNFKN